MTERKRPGNGFKDMTGEVIGKLTVLDYVGSDGTQRAAVWRCRCECGNEVEVRGTALRKGHRKSCGCLDPLNGKRQKSTTSGRPASPLTPRETFDLAERHGLLALVWSHLGTEVLVEFDKSEKAWVCSDCGAGARCAHIEAATRDMPLEMVSEVAAVVAPRKAGSLSAGAGGAAAEGMRANDRALAAALAKSAVERAERLAERDKKHEAIVGEVTVRRMTDEERARLEERRSKKAQAFAY